MYKQGALPGYTETRTIRCIYTFKSEQILRHYTSSLDPVPFPQAQRQKISSSSGTGKATLVLLLSAPTAALRALLSLVLLPGADTVPLIPSASGLVQIGPHHHDSPYFSPLELLMLLLSVPSDLKL